MNVLVSKAADLNTPFFLNLPAEIRNCIYAILFDRDDALQLTHTDDGSFALIHQEAAPILYSNTFLLRATRNDYHDHTGLHVNSVSAAWLRQIGQHSNFVQKLTIDLGNIGPSDCYCRGPELPETFRRSDSFIRCGALMNAIWSSHPNMTVSFIDSGIIPRFCTPPLFPRSTSPVTSCNTERLSHVLQQIARDDLGMKKFRRAIGEIGITPDGFNGVFVFRTTDWQTRQDDLSHRYKYSPFNPFFENARFFEAPKDGAIRFCVDKMGRKRRIVFGVPSKVVKVIVDYTLDSVTSYEIDLDSFTNFTDLCGILYVDWELHEKELDKFFLNHTFNISMTADMNTNFDTSKLGRLINARIGDLFSFGRRYSADDVFGRNVDFSINLHIQSAMQTPPPSSNGARINVMPLIAATLRAKGDRHITIHTHSGNEEARSNTISVQKLRRLALPVLQKYVLEYHAKDAGVLCPELWMDNQGIVDVVSTGSVVLGRRKDPAEEYRALWSAWKTGYVGAKAPPVADIDGLARSMYLYLKWITL
ncbi:hypothetical protein DE146DRAFT_618609 [Phaeosphaeria sp. MPI-PUGE-AT-0046c]|nr:hypothetical protein DE146DRAFT_618609 [Phaeosphaeria sp. MPI-PUGE-AT-0046c]